METEAKNRAVLDGTEWHSGFHAAPSSCPAGGAINSELLVSWMCLLLSLRPLPFLGLLLFLRLWVCLLPWRDRKGKPMQMTVRILILKFSSQMSPAYILLYLQAGDDESFNINEVQIPSKNKMFLFVVYFWKSVQQTLGKHLLTSHFPNSFK